MKNIIRLLVLSGLMMACQEHQEDFPQDDQRTVELSAQISSEGARADLVTVGKQYFENKDQMGLFVDAQGTQTCWTFDANKWTSNKKVYWKEPESTFCAYYPYAERAVYDVVPMPDLTRQKGTDKDINSFDFVVSKANFVYNDCKGIVSFTEENSLKHVYAMVIVNIKNKYTDEAVDVDYVNFVGDGLFTQSSYSFVKDKIEMVYAGGEKNSLKIDYPSGQQLSSTENLIVKIFVNPKTCKSPLKFSLGYTDHVQSKTAVADNLSNEFKAGFYYKYNMTLNNRSELVITGVNINGTENEDLPDLILPDAE